MQAHSEGKTLGNTKLHSKLYRREDEFYKLIEDKSYQVYNDNAIDNLLSLEGMNEHYTSIYELRNKEICLFFDKYDSDRLFVGNLKEGNKWIKLADFFNIRISDNYTMHANKSKY